MVTKRKVRKFLNKLNNRLINGSEESIFSQYAHDRHLPNTQHHKLKCYIKELLPQIKLERLLKGE